MKFTEFIRTPLFLKILFVISIAVIFFISGITYKHLTRLSNSSDQVTRAYEMSLQLEKLMSQIKDAETGNRGYIITKDSTFLEPYLFARLRINTSLTVLEHFSNNRQLPNENLILLRKLTNSRLAQMEKSIVFAQQNKTEALQENLLKGKATMDSIRQCIANMTDLETKLLSVRQENYKNTFSITPIFIYIVILIGLILTVLSFVKINRDLNELKKTNNQLLIANESGNIAEIVGNFGRWEYDIEKNKYRFSDNMFRLLGSKPDAFQASLDTYMKYIHPDDGVFVKRTMEKMMATNNDLPSFNYRIKREDGEIRYFKTVGKLVTNKSGEQILVGTTSDITEEYNTTKEIEQRNTELERSNKELTAFNYVASHDLQEPLRKIQTFISRLADKEAENLSETGNEYLKRITAASDRMRNLIDDLLEFSRSNKAEKEFETTDLNTLLQNSKLELSSIIEDKKAVIISDTLPVLNVIPFQIQQLFTNIIGNSMKYSKEGIAPQIFISATKVKASSDELLNKNPNDFYYKISITDNGIGFEQEYAEKIFILFNRLHNKNEYDGTGIGLAICKKIIDNHKGYILAKGEPNIGAVFTFYLPTDLHNN
ncbi:CHASE3 domain-containing protein [Flavobacterium sp. SM15]|uniref:sensor histidine kinase n=1 Tax=Flavobacterium sp. SM15 TaxID=2908005 RepID=UPI001EDA394C|nr:sensor histidine kinase [Flavobacterium sp. SM15]MCG2612538.1 CHASE3 domain-containing protein [Flavobacterium sp. SM15]